MQLGGASSIHDSVFWLQRLGQNVPVVTMPAYSSSIAKKRSIEHSSAGISSHSAVWKPVLSKRSLQRSQTQHRCESATVKCFQGPTDTSANTGSVDSMTALSGMNMECTTTSRNLLRSDLDMQVGFQEVGCTTGSVPELGRVALLQVISFQSQG